MADQEVNPNSLPFILGGIRQEMADLNLEQKNINTRLNNQNGQIRAMAEALARNTETIQNTSKETLKDLTELCDWRDGHEKEHREGLKTKIQNNINLKQAFVIAFVSAVLGGGVGYIISCLAGG